VARSVALARYPAHVQQRRSPSLPLLTVPELGARPIPSERTPEKEPGGAPRQGDRRIGAEQHRRHGPGDLVRTLESYLVRFFNGMRLAAAAIARSEPTVPAEVAPISAS